MQRQDYRALMRPPQKDHLFSYICVLGLVFLSAMGSSGPSAIVAVYAWVVFLFPLLFFFFVFRSVCLFLRCLYVCVFYFRVRQTSRSRWGYHVLPSLSGMSSSSLYTAVSVEKALAFRSECRESLLAIFLVWIADDQGQLVAVLSVSLEHNLLAFWRKHHADFVVFVVGSRTARHNPIAVNDPESREAPPADPTSMFGIFDGHGGDFTSTFCARELIECLRGTSGWKSGDRWGVRGKIIGWVLPSGPPA